MSEYVFGQPAEAKATRVPWGELVIIMLLGFGSFLTLATFLGVIVILSSGGQITGGLLVTTAIANFVCFAGTTATYGLWRGRITLATLGLRPFRWEFWWLPFGILVALLMYPIRALAGLISQSSLSGNLDSIVARSDFMLSNGTDFTGFLITLVSIGILIPIGEELFFRGLLHGWTQKYIASFWIRASVSGGLFALAHFDSIGVVVSSFLIAGVMSLMYERTRSILMPIIIHVTTNSVAVMLLYASTWLNLGGL